MFYTIENEFLRISVEEQGAELSSIFSKPLNKELLWQGNEKFWTGRAPILFPAIGATKGGTYFLNGEEYPMIKHGLVRTSEEVKMVSKTDDKISFLFSSSEETLKYYPFDFELLIHFALEGNKLNVIHEVKNLGDEAMYYQLGGHPAFNVPLFDGEEYEDYYLEFEHKEHAVRHLISEEGLINHETELVLDNSNRLDLHKELFNRDALIFKSLQSKKISLVSSKSGQVFQFDFTGFPYLGIWAKPGAPFVCIEPWQGITDAVNHSGKIEEKDGVMKLNAGKERVSSYMILIDL